MFMAPIQPPLGHRMVRLMRRWTAEAREGGPQLAGFVTFAATLGIQPMAAVAIASLFQLTEACLGRSLVAECCCSRRMSRDERAILLLLGTARPAHPHQSFPQIPHGLPAALLWTVESVRKLTGDFADLATARPARCPFG